MAQKITFTVSAEIADNATSGILLGDFNNWEFEKGIALKKQKDGSLKTTVALESGTYQYRYFLSDGRWVNDGNADAYVYSEEFFVDNCVINVPEEAPKPSKKASVKPAPLVAEASTVAPKKAATKKAVAKPIEPVIVAPVVTEKKATEAKKEVVAPAVEAAPAPKKAATKTAAAKPTKAAKAKK
ncbi:isoamylase early set domain-containing protein [Parasediminibacterium paludis]|uniref:Isoamylase early set domain-containing protein n=1 Tax=Parasediminibacterium paludis TaxID=908966 RepID=A0ABV8PXJ2_9BACT